MAFSTYPCYIRISNIVVEDATYLDLTGLALGTTGSPDPTHLWPMDITSTVAPISGALLDIAEAMDTLVRWSAAELPALTFEYSLTDPTSATFLYLRERRYLALETQITSCKVEHSEDNATWTTLHDGAIYRSSTDDTWAAWTTLGTYPIVEPVVAGPEPLPHFYRLSAYLSGAEDALTDVAFLLTSFSLFKRSGSVSYYSMSAPFSQALLDAFIARPNGIIHILRDGDEWETCNQSHPIRYDIGPSNSSLSLSGSRTQTLTGPQALAVTDDMATSSAINSSGELTLGLVPKKLDPRPGDSITWDGDTYTVSLVKFQSGSASQTLSINAT